MRNFSELSKLNEAFRDLRGQIQKSYNPPTQKRNVTSDYYNNFLNKYRNLSEENVQSFNARDLMYFFREKSKETDSRYVISNMHRDMGIFKRLQSNYSNMEICTMIEFLFYSSQNYLEKVGLQPTVLASSWCNTIFRDTMLWVEDKYHPTATRKVSREWVSNNAENVKIGEWD